MKKLTKLVLHEKMPEDQMKHLLGGIGYDYDDYDDGSTDGKICDSQACKRKACKDRACHTGA